MGTVHSHVPLARDILPADKTAAQLRSQKTIIYAPFSGTIELHPRAGKTYWRYPNVADAGDGGYGNYVVLRNGKYRLLMGHFADNPSKSQFAFPGIKSGAVVEIGTPLGYLGETGISSISPHIHMEMSANGQTVIPLNVLPQYKEAVAWVYKDSGQSQKAMVQAPTPISAKAVQVVVPSQPTQSSSQWQATDSGLTVKVVDERKNKTPLNQWPDAGKIASALVREIPGILEKIRQRVPGGNYECAERKWDGKSFEVVLVDSVTSAGRRVDGIACSHFIKISGGIASQGMGGVNLMVSHELAHVRSILLEGWDKAADEVAMTRYEDRFRGLTIIPAPTPTPTPTKMKVPVVSASASSASESWFSRLLGLGVAGSAQPQPVQKATPTPAGSSGITVDLAQTTFAGVYGNLCGALLGGSKGSLGVLGSKKTTYPLAGGKVYPCSVIGALDVTSAWANWVDSHNGDKTLVKVLAPTIGGSNKTILQQVIDETARRNQAGEKWFVLLDEPGHTEVSIKLAMQKWTTYPHVGYVLDLEWFGRKVPVSEINRIASYYFDLRRQRGFTGIGILGVWYYKPGTLNPDEPLKTNDFGIVVPMYDGYGGASAKLSGYQSMLTLFKSNFGGMMGFTWRWGSRYDSARPEDLFKSSQLFWVQQ